MCTTPYRPIKMPKEMSDKEIMDMIAGPKGAGLSYPSIYIELIEKRKKHNITSDGSLLGEYVR